MGWELLLNPMKSDNVEFVRYCGGHFEKATGRNLSMSGINSGHHYLPPYQSLMISDNVKFLRYCGGHFENGRHFENFENTETSKNFYRSPFLKWPPQYRTHSTLFDFNVLN
jgi:peptide subunit release factor RF-3